MTPATPTRLTRAHVTAQVAGAAKVSPQISWSEAGLPKIAQHMFSLMLRNLASDGFLFMDPTHSGPNDPQSFSLPGCIIAAPSFPANTSGIDQDYVYNWLGTRPSQRWKLLPPNCLQLRVLASSR
jgi:glucoamylase